MEDWRIILIPLVILAAVTFVGLTAIFDTDERDRRRRRERHIQRQLGRK